MREVGDDLWKEELEALVALEDLLDRVDELLGVRLGVGDVEHPNIRVADRAPDEVGAEQRGLEEATRKDHEGPLRTGLKHLAQWQVQVRREKVQAEHPVGE